MMRRVLAFVLSFIIISFLGLRTGRADGLIVITNPPVAVPGHFSFAPLEVTYHRVECDIQDQAAVTSVDQEFYNPNNARLEGEYIFPVPKDAQIDKFAMDIDGKMVEAELLPADKARKVYEDIVRASKDPALLEYAGRAMFRVHIFPIEPNKGKRIQLKYTELIKQDNSLLDYHYTLNTEKFSSKPLKNVSLKVNIHTTEPITTLYSPTHEVDISRHGDNNATVGFEAKDIRPDTDFHLFIGRKTTPVGISLMTYRPDPDQDGYFVLMAAPTLSKNAKAMSKDVVFVMDTSGSMSGAKIDQARKALKYCVETLNPQDRFDIVRFSTEAEPFFGTLKEANDENRKKAAEFAANLKAAGGTAIDEAMKQALEEREGKDDRLFLIVFMTDGQPTVGEQNPDVILAHVKQASKGAPVRIFSFGVGTDVNTKLLDLMAEQTRGYSQYVLPNENLELSMSNFWGKVQDPVLANLKLDTGGVTVAKVYPRDLPDLFKGDQVVVFGTYTKGAKGAVTITGNVGGQVQKFAQDVVFEDQTDSSREWIAKLWATRRVAYLLDEIRLHGESKELKDEVVDLARRWGVVTPYTAMLIIEDEKRRNVPVAERSLREMEHDRVASAKSAADYDMIRKGGATGSDAIAGSISGNAQKSASNLQVAQSAAEQKDDRFIAHGESGGVGRGGGLDPGKSLAKAASPAAPANTYAGGTVVTDGTLALDGAASGPAQAAPMPAAELKELNLGTQTVNGWQTADKKKDGDAAGKPGEVAAQGYRVVNNYAQQTRVVNNRAFFLNGNQWTDSRTQNAKTESKHVKIIFNSEAYFDLLKKHTDAAQYFALGNNVTVELDGTIYDIVEEPIAPTPAPGK